MYGRQSAGQGMGEGESTRGDQGGIFILDFFLNDGLVDSKYGNGMELILESQIRIVKENDSFQK